MPRIVVPLPQVIIGSPVPPTPQISVPREQLVEVVDAHRFVEVRREGALRGRCLFLDQTYQYVIGIDDWGYKVLVPLKP